MLFSFVGSGAHAVGLTTTSLAIPCAGTRRAGRRFLAIIVALVGLGAPLLRPRAPVVLLLLTVALCAPMVAASTLPDPIWIGGLYDNGDEDAVLALVWEQSPGLASRIPRPRCSFGPQSPALLRSADRFVFVGTTRRSRSSSGFGRRECSCSGPRMKKLS